MPQMSSGSHRVAGLHGSRRPPPRLRPAQQRPEASSPAAAAAASSAASRPRQAPRAAEKIMSLPNRPHYSVFVVLVVVSSRRPGSVTSTVGPARDSAATTLTVQRSGQCIQFAEAVFRFLGSPACHPVNVPPVCALPRRGVLDLPQSPLASSSCSAMPVSSVTSLSKLATASRKPLLSVFFGSGGSVRGGGAGVELV